jgi:hypothetical protein
VLAVATGSLSESSPSLGQEFLSLPHAISNDTLIDLKDSQGCSGYGESVLHGYESETAFSRAVKKLIDRSSGLWRSSS